MHQTTENCLISVSIQKSDFDINSEINLIKSSNIGGIINFVGVVRDNGEEREQLVSLELEHYPEMTENAIMEICIAAKKRWKLCSIRVIHRVGTLLVGDNIVLVITASAHRIEAFKSAEFIMDYLKSRAPIWKKEHYENEDSEWLKGNPISGT